MNQTALVRETGVHRRRMQKELERLHEACAISFESSGIERASRGHPLGFYYLNQAQREAARDVLASLPGAQQLVVGQSWVLATFETSKIPDLMEVFSTAELAVSAEWIARVGGETHGYVFGFGPEHGQLAADKLVTAFVQAGITATSGVVGDVQSPQDFLRHSAAIRERRRQVRRRPNGGTRQHPARD